MKYYTLANSYVDRMNELHYIRLKEITTEICKYFVIDIDDLKSTSRTGHNIMARNFCIYFMNKYLNDKIKSESNINRVIGKYFKRDRTTIRHHKLNTNFYINNNIQYKHHHFDLHIILTENELI